MNTGKAEKADSRHVINPSPKQGRELITEMIS
jgi:hypothetical protein